MHSTDIRAYTFEADIYGPCCIVSQLEEAVLAGDGAHDFPVEEALDLIAFGYGIDRFAEDTFDSDEFPKVVFADQVDDDAVCGACGGAL